MASLAEHIATLQFMRSRLNEAVEEDKKGGDKIRGLLYELSVKMMTKDYMDECASMVYTHIDELAALVPQDELAAATAAIQVEVEEAKKKAAQLSEILKDGLGEMLSKDDLFGDLKEKFDGPIH